jgi:hypothetical protein
MNPTLVDNSESIYRSIRHDAGEYTEVNGKVVFSASAFNDKEHKPSVDRSAIRLDPKDARRSISDGIAKIEVADVRARCDIKIVDDKGRETGEYAVDVIHRPLSSPPEPKKNCAHCQIECSPSIASGSRFRKLKEALAALAGQHGFLVKPGASA